MFRSMMGAFVFACLALVPASANSQTEAHFGVLSKLAGTIWTGENGTVAFEWIVKGEYLVALFYSGESRRSNEFRLGLDGQKITFLNKGPSGVKSGRVDFPSNNSYIMTENETKFLQAAG